MKDVKILITDDHPMIRHGIRSLLADEKEFSLINEATNGEDALSKLSEQHYDLVIMDIKMPKKNGIEATKEIRKLHPNTKVLAISMYDEQSYIVRILRAGALGYILKNTGKEELLSAIRQVMKGENYFSPEVSGIMMSHIISGKPITQAEVSVTDIALTKREREIIRLIAEEHTNVEIGEALGISPRTVDTHRRNLLQKLNVKNTAGLVKYAINNGLLD